MADNRRQFIRRGGTLIGAATLGPVSLSAAGKNTTPLRRSPLGVPKTVLDFLHRNGVKEALLRGGSVLGQSSAEVSIDLAGITANSVLFFQRVASSRIPFENLYAAAGAMSFSTGGAFFNVEVLGKGDLRDLKAGLSSGKGITFAHEALLQSLDGGGAFDPWKVLPAGGRTLRMVGTASQTVDQKVAAVIKGLADSAVYKLPPVQAMKDFQERLLTGAPANDTEASAIANEVTAGINRLALCSPGALPGLLTSPLISESLRKTFGRTGREVVSVVQTSAASGDAPGAPWLLGILGTERLRIRQGAVWIQDPDRHSFLQTRSALAAARSLARTVS